MRTFYVQHFVFYADSRTAAVALNRQEQEQEQGLPTHPPFPSYGSNKASPSMQACTCICMTERRQWWVGRTAYAKLSRPYSAENTGLEKANHNPAICAPGPPGPPPQVFSTTSKPSTQLTAAEQHFGVTFSALRRGGVHLFHLLGPGERARGIVQVSGKRSAGPTAQRRAKSAEAGSEGRCCPGPQVL